jgi:hypothetical protein
MCRLLMFSCTYWSGSAPHIALRLATNQKVGSSNLSGRTILPPLLQALSCAADRPFDSIFSMCPILCPPKASMTANTESSDGWHTVRTFVRELSPAIRASVHASQPDSPSLVRNVCRREYKTNGRTLESLRAFECCFFCVGSITRRVVAPDQQPSLSPGRVLLRPAEYKGIHRNSEPGKSNGDSTNKTSRTI